MQFQKKSNDLNKNPQHQLDNKNSSTKIDLPSVNKITQGSSIPVFLKIQSLINDTVYRRIFSDNQLCEVLKNIYDNEKLENTQNYQHKLSRSKIIEKSKYLKVICRNRNYFAKRVRKSILQDTVKGSRHLESKNPLSLQSDFNITPIKLYQYNLLSKYCLLKNYVCLPSINLDCIDFQEKLEFNPFISSAAPNYSNPVQLVECAKYNLPSITPLITINLAKITKTTSITYDTDKSIKSSDRKNCKEKFAIQSASSSFNQVNEKITSSNTPKSNNLRNGLIETKQFNKEEILQETEHIVKAHYKGYVQPRLSKENIQELIRQSLSNVMNKDKESINQSEIRKQLKSILKEKSNHRRRSTISESQHFTESGDFEISTVDLSDSPSSDDMAINESFITTMAINSTKEYIKSTEVLEDVTWSGNKLGKHCLNLDILSTSGHDGNYGYIDGVNLKNKIYKNYSYRPRDKMANETFTALSHMYSLKKLLERKSVNIGQQQQNVINSQSYSFSKLILGSDESFESEQSSEDSLIESFQSCDVNLINIFKNKLCE